MASIDTNGNRSARLVWAVITPPALVLAALSLIGFFFIPAICLYLDGRSRTYTGAATVVVATAAVSLTMSAALAGLFVFITIATATAYVLARVKLPFQIGLAGSAVGGVLGAMAFLGILGASLGGPIADAGSKWLYGVFNLSIYDMNLWDPWASSIKLMEKGQSALSLQNLLQPDALQPLVFSESERSKIIVPFLEVLISQTLPGFALSTGLLTGGLGYYLAVMSLQAARRRGKATAGEPVEVPPFSSFKFPKYIVLSVFALQMIAMFGAEANGFTTLSIASSLLFNVLMTIQALAFFSFLLGRKKIGPWVQLIILAPALALFFWLMPYVGFFDALFDIRTVMERVDALKAKGKQVFTQDGLDELRKMDQSRKNRKNGKDGEDDDQ